MATPRVVRARIDSNVITPATLRWALEDIIQSGSDGPRDGVSFSYRGSVYIRRAQFCDWLVGRGYSVSLRRAGEILREFGMYQYTFKYMSAQGHATSLSMYRSQLETLLDGLPEWPGPRMARPGEQDPEATTQPHATDRRPGDTPSRLPAHLRLAVEIYAENRVIAHYEADGWVLQRVSHRKLGWDLTATRGAEARHIEVKGSTGLAAAVELTANEVVKARAHPGRAVLAIVSGIRLEDEQALGGGIEIVFPWSPSAADLTVTRYTYVPPRDLRAGRR